MFSVRCVFVGEDGRVFSTPDELTPTDLEQAEVVIVTIVSISDGRFFGRAREWLPIPAGRLGSADVDGEPTPPFHAPASYFEETTKRS